MSVSKLKGKAAKLANPSKEHKLILDLLEGRAKLKADAKFKRITIESSAHCVTWDIGIPLSEHQCKVYRKLISVKPGSTVSYGALACEVGSAPRAIGGAMAHNPFPFLVPCHRVIKADGTIGGWSPIEGIDLKKALLAYEAQKR
jgi:O-6-methylguanine DNA methyltransferase